MKANRNDILDKFARMSVRKFTIRCNFNWLKLTRPDRKMACLEGNFKLKGRDVYFE